MTEPKLNFTSLGGVNEVTKNMYLYEWGQDVLVVDCGIGFPEEASWGVDLVIPDIKYLKPKQASIRGLLITHGHEDHYGALPYLLPELGYPPIWATRLTIGFIESKLREFGQLHKARINLIDPDADRRYQFGIFQVTPFRINHSVPDTIGLVIETPVGRLVHLADFKFDWQAVSGQRFDVQKLALLVGKGVLGLASDCLGVNHPGYTRSEREIEVALDQIVRGSKGRVFFTTIASNISRMQQAINVARKYRRAVVTLGRSVSGNVKIAQELGYLDLVDKEVMAEKQAKHKARQQLLYLVGGSYGQEDSALARLARGEHPLAKAEPGDTVVFSADPAPPGTRAQVDLVVDHLMQRGVEVYYYEIQENLYVSGHGSRDDLAFLINLTRPRFLIPIGGTPRHLYAYENLVNEINVGGKVLILEPGDVLTIQPDRAAVTGRIPLERIYIDRAGRSDIDEQIIKKRRRLGQAGAVIVSLVLNRQTGRIQGHPELLLTGTTLGRDQAVLMRKIKELVIEIAQTSNVAVGLKVVRQRIETEVAELILSKLGRQPVVLVMINK